MTDSPLVQTDPATPSVPTCHRDDCPHPSIADHGDGPLCHQHAHEDKQARFATSRAATEIARTQKAEDETAALDAAADAAEQAAERTRRAFDALRSEREKTREAELETHRRAAWTLAGGSIADYEAKFHPETVSPIAEAPAVEVDGHVPGCPALEHEGAGCVCVDDLINPIVVLEDPIVWEDPEKKPLVTDGHTPGCPAPEREGAGCICPPDAV